MASVSLVGTLSVGQASVVSSGYAPVASRTESFDLAERTSPTEALGGGPMPVSGTFALPLGSIASVAMFYIKVYSGSLEVRLTSSAGSAQAFPVGSGGQLFLSQTGITAITLVGTATVEYCIAGA